ncbi:UNKNOWN [Stylonychia lemnae]|uniref:Uncharacterized protein n=1 Tax=Stylonychia lemnae TaxID=5949 RepID=A0A077ZT58_STYLE|nr:UNKNOWN [Stylonychia lemnae]|eukprot:CDW73068.1 UNKNOWN [Stylonychia lemnae]
MHCITNYLTSGGYSIINLVRTLIDPSKILQMTFKKYPRISQQLRVEKNLQILLHLQENYSIFVRYMYALVLQSILEIHRNDKKFIFSIFSQQVLDKLLFYVKDITANGLNDDKNEFLIVILWILNDISCLHTKFADYLVSSKLIEYSFKIIEDSLSDSMDSHELVIAVSQTFTSLISCANNIKKSQQKDLVKFIMSQIIDFYGANQLLSSIDESITEHKDSLDYVLNLINSINKLLSQNNDKIYNTMMNNQYSEKFLMTVIQIWKAKSFQLRLISDSTLQEDYHYSEMLQISEFFYQILQFQDEYIIERVFGFRIVQTMQVVLENMYRSQNSRFTDALLSNLLKCVCNILSTHEVDKVCDYLLKQSSLLKDIFLIVMQDKWKLGRELLDMISQIIQNLTFVSDVWCIQDLFDKYIIHASLFIMRMAMDLDEIQIIQVNLMSLISFSQGDMDIDSQFIHQYFYQNYQLRDLFNQIAQDFIFEDTKESFFEFLESIGSKYDDDLELMENVDKLINYVFKVDSDEDELDVDNKCGEAEMTLNQQHDN